MRLLLSFFIGFFSAFFISNLIDRLFKNPIRSISGLSLIILGLAFGFLGRFFIPIPLDIFLAFFLMGSGLGIIIYHLISQGYIFSENNEHNFVKKHPVFFERLLEILPGALTWLALTSPIWLSLTLPYALAYLIILADIYWLVSSIKIALLIYLGYRKMSWAQKQEWLKKLQYDFPNQWDKYYHLVVLPRFNEDIKIVGPAIDAVIGSNYPKDRVFLAVGFEQRSKTETTMEVEKYLKKKQGSIAGIFITTHPFGLPGEIPGPATNRNYMIKNASEQFKKLDIDPRNVFVTTLDADFVVHKEFLAGALHKYLSTPKGIRNKRSFTGVFLYYNNYWQAPTPMRLIATGTAFWQLAEMVGSDKYQNYSSLSINLQSLLDIGLWIPDKVNDDSGFYWKAYFHFKGDYKVIPHFLPISADAVLDVNLVKTFQNQYLQLKRWAYGVEHIPYVFKQYFVQKDIDFWDKTDKLTFEVWAKFKWGTLALFVTFAGIIIPAVNPSYGESAVSINLPILSSWIMTIAFLGLFATIYVHEKTVPKRPDSWSVLTKFWSYIQWLLIPIVLITISTIPAIDAQTSLMFGRYLEFRATNKIRLT